MGFTSDGCWFLLIKTLLIKNNKKREAALKNEAGGDEKHVFFLLGLINPLLTKFVRSRWLDIGLVLFLRVYGPRLRLGP